MRAKTLIAFTLLALAAPAALAGNNKIEICHFPPGNPDNFHTITISDKALTAHLNHGDLAGTCEENCDTLCGDADPCTQDVDPYAAGCACLPDHPPVDCDDTNLCTADSCDPAAGGCLNAPINCSDGDLCTVDVCDPLTGNCANPPVSCGTGEVCDPGSGSCVDPCAGVICEPLDQCHLAGTCEDGICDDPVAPDGTFCDDGDPGTSGDVCTGGVCAGTAGPTCSTCTENNPCTPENIENELFYHTHCDPTMFVQCDQWGGCFEMPCALGTVWDQEAYTCVGA